MNGSILIIEDEDRLRKNIAAYLTRGGFTVQQAANARDARSALNAAPPAIIVVDLGLPDANGLELLEEIQAGHRRIGAIVMTGQPSPENTLKAARLGASVFLVKPVSCRQLRDAVIAVREKLGGAGMGHEHELIGTTSTTGAP